MRAQREAVAVSSHGQITGYFVGPDEYEEFKRFREKSPQLRHRETSPRRKSKPDPGPRAWIARHAHLDKLLDPK